MDHAKLFGKRIRAVRKAANLTQERVAERAKLNAKYVSLIETGRKKPSFDAIVALADALRVPVSALFLFEREEHDERVIRRRMETLLSKCNPQQVELVYRFTKMIAES